MTCHDYLFYASQDYGAVAHSADLIGSYALMYAINRRIPEVRRAVSGNKPHYEDDLPKMRVYATPAGFVDDFPYHGTGSKNRWLGRQIQLGGTFRKTWRRRSQEMITWNSIGEELLDKMKQDNLNIPKVGSYFKHPPMTSFYFYTVGGPIPKVIRIGKKFAPARLNTIALKSEEKSGVFQPTCPVNVVDIPKETRILGGSILMIPPAPVLVASRLEGEYLECKDPKSIVHYFPRPKKDRFKEAWAVGG
jgi:CRISPR type I-D-associated protein Csc1